MNVNPTTREALTYLDLAPMRRCIQEHRNRIAAVIMECLHGTARYVARPWVPKQGRLSVFHFLTLWTQVD